MTVVVNHDYPQLHALQVLQEDGTPIEGARIRIYDANRYYVQDLANWVTQQPVLFESTWDSSMVLFGEPEAFNVLLQTSWMGDIYTDANGEWTSDMLLPEAHTWLLYIEYDPDFESRIVEVTT
jgi:protocatechuate 3,4-dioxygenase beta subunit